MLYEEFLRGTNNEDRGHLESVWAAYEFLNNRQHPRQGGTK
jgi:hypothetical protein